jgi:hypothetical protein
LSNKEFERWEDAASDKIDVGFEWIVGVAAVAVMGLLAWSL